MKALLSAICISTLGAAACATAPQATMEDPGAGQPTAVTRAVAVLQPTQGSAVQATVRFVDNGDGSLAVTTEASGLPAGKHAYHIHVWGDCSGPKGKTAGTHFHFHGSALNPGKDIQIITGDLGELVADADGNASHETVITGAALQGPYAVLGRAIIIHEKGNDHSQPPIGAAGGRIACGVIGIEPVK
ncbi:MAG: Cu-Zn family superoxide dismutase [Myxococcota bacterium]|jgi:Cu-Zn family superoxide dismutase